MIYEQINGYYQSLANQWFNLAQSFRRLATLFPGDDAKQRALRLTPDGLAFLCDHETDLDIPGDKGGYFQFARELVSSPEEDGDITTAIEKAIAQFEANEASRSKVKGFFRSNDYLGTVMFPEPAGGGGTEPVEVLDCRENLEQLSLFIANTIQKLQELITPNTSVPASLSGIRNAVDDIASYPVLTSELGISPAYGPLAPPVSTGGSGGSLQRTVDNAVRDVLGHLPRAKDTRSFMLALNQSFQLTEVQGHTVVTWTPRSFTGQTDLSGGVTGAQASLFTRSKVALESGLPLLEGLYPLLPDFDPQLIGAARTIVNSEMVEIVNELGIEGGPRVTRVDKLFEALFESQNTNPDPGGPLFIGGGHLGYLRAAFGLFPERVNSLEEERNVTNFISLRDYIVSIQTSWISFRDQWLGKDLGTRLVQLSRTLSVTAETVSEVNFAMDSVFVGSAERQVVSFHDQAGRSVLIDELLSWVAQFATDEAPNLVHEAGKRGAAAIIPTGQELVRLVTRFIQQIPFDPDLPAGLRHPRVLPPLHELRMYLQRVVDLAQDINRPVVGS